MANSALPSWNHSSTPLRFVISGEARLPRDGVIEIPLLRLLNSERETGGIAVEILGAGEIKDQKAQGLEEADASDLGAMIANRQSPALLVFRARAGDAGATRSLNVNVARYDQQAVLMANIEEARYQVLISADGKELVQARYAVRNNQRNFVKITLPGGATVWSATLAGKPVRPGQAPDGSLLLPLEKSMGGDDAPAFPVEIVYLAKSAAWHEKGRQSLTLPALDLPISRTGMLLYYPPAYKVSAEAGLFRTQEYQSPTSAVLTAASGEGPGLGRAAEGAWAEALSELEAVLRSSCDIGSRQGRAIRKAAGRGCQGEERRYGDSPEKFPGQVGWGKSNWHSASQRPVPRFWSVNFPGFRAHQ